MGWLKEVFSLLELTWTEVLLGLSLFVVTSIGGIFLVSFLLVKLPATYFCDSHPRDFWVDRHPILRWTGLIIKNLLGALIVILGIILSLPGVPGPGILTILMGVLLLDFPGKRRLERWLLSRPSSWPRSTGYANASASRRSFWRAQKQAQSDHMTVAASNPFAIAMQRHLPEEKVKNLSPWFIGVDFLQYFAFCCPQGKSFLLLLWQSFVAPFLRC